MAALEITDLSWPDGSVALIVTGVVADDTAGAFGRALDSAIGSRHSPATDRSHRLPARFPWASCADSTPTPVE